MRGKFARLSRQDLLEQLVPALFERGDLPPREPVTGKVHGNLAAPAHGIVKTNLAVLGQNLAALGADRGALRLAFPLLR